MKTAPQRSERRDCKSLILRRTGALSIYPHDGTLYTYSLGHNLYLYFIHSHCTIGSIQTPVTKRYSKQVFGSKHFYEKEELLQSRCGYNCRQNYSSASILPYAGFEPTVPSQSHARCCSISVSTAIPKLSIKTTLANIFYRPSPRFYPDQAANKLFHRYINYLTTGYCWVHCLS